MQDMIRNEQGHDELSLLGDTLRAWADRLERLDDMCQLVGHLAATTKEEILAELGDRLREVRREYEQAFEAYEDLKERLLARALLRKRGGHGG